MHKYFLTYFLVFLAKISFAQDPHFSQYFASPITLNPANIGAFDGQFRLAANFRNQWWGVGSAYKTTTISYEQKLSPEVENKTYDFSLGGMFLSDESAAGALKVTYASLGAGFHKYLDAYNEHSLGLGVTASYGQHSLDVGQLTFLNQFSSGGFNTNLSSNEFGIKPIKYFDVAAGLLYRYQTEATSIYFGAGMYNILQPNASFYSNTANALGNKIPRRYVLNANYTEKKMDGNMWFASLNYMNQNGATDLIGGLGYSFLISNYNHLKYNFFTAGIFYRYQDAIIPYAGLNVGNYQFGISYDATTLGPKLSSPKNGSLEISFIYKKPPSISGNLKCPSIF